MFQAQLQITAYSSLASQWVANATGIKGRRKSFAQPADYNVGIVSYDKLKFRRNDMISYNNTIMSSILDFGKYLCGQETAA